MNITPILKWAFSILIDGKLKRKLSPLPFKQTHQARNVILYLKNVKWEHDIANKYLFKVITKTLD